MSDDSKDNLPAYYAPAPAPLQQHAPAHGSVHLPAGNAWFGRTSTVLRKNATQVRGHADWLAARTEQANNARGYVDAKIELTRSVARLAWLPEVLESDYRRGLEDMRHEFEMLSIAHATSETHARAQLVAAHNYLASLQPQPQKPAQTTAAAGLTPADVQKVAQMMPDVKPETIEALVLALGGFMAEKNR